MLDFYLIKDESKKPSHPEQTKLIYAGGLELEAFDELQRKNIIESCFDYWSDFRWSSEYVQQKVESLVVKYPDVQENTMKTKTPEAMLFTILEKAVRENYGLIAYCD